MKVYYWSLVPIAYRPLNKGHIGDNINSAVVSFLERLSSSQRFKCIREIRVLKSVLVERSIILYPYLREFTIGCDCTYCYLGSTLLAFGLRCCPIVLIDFQ